MRGFDWRLKPGMLEQTSEIRAKTANFETKQKKSRKYIYYEEKMSEMMRARVSRRVSRA
jgi:hypothetical protein